MSAKLRSIARQLGYDQPKPPAPAPAGGFASAMDAYINERVEAGVAEALERHRERLSVPPVPVPRIDFKDVPPPPRTTPPVDMSMLIERDELGRVQYMSIGKTRLLAQRNELGQVVRLVPAADTAPPPPAIPPRTKAEIEYFEALNK